MKLIKGYVHLYTGDGKGKTTAAFGLALRAAGAGMKVFIAQFLKGRVSSEVKALEKHSGEITLRQYGRDCLIKEKPAQEDSLLAGKGLKEAREAMLSGNYDLVILDEAALTTYFNLLSVEDLLNLIKEKPDSVELVITGRKADPQLIEAADLVTEMKEVKHYYQQGLLARTGIED